VDLEIEYGWTGLFIEADPSLHTALKRSNRNGWISNVCLSPKPYPMEVSTEVIDTATDLKLN